MPGRPYVLAETAWKTIRAAPPEVAVLPWGATEAHNLHLPHGTDTLQAEAVAIEAARLAWALGARVTVLPAIPYGVQTGQLDIPICINVNPSTQALLLRDIAHSLKGHGVQKLVVLNGHGGNDFRPMIRELQPVEGLFVSLIHWYACVDPQPYFDPPGDHAGALETGVMLHLAPEWVLPLGEAGPGKERRFALEGLREGWVWAPRKWSQVTDDTGVGDPRSATPEQGAAFFRAVCDRIGGYLAELARADLDRLYEREGMDSEPSENPEPS
jgi:creatinine amidohydrolase